MAQLIMVILSIFLFGIFLLIGINSLNSIEIKANYQADIITLGFASISSSLSSYKNVYYSAPNEETWEDELFPAFGSKPDDGIGSWHLMDSGNTICYTLPKTKLGNKIFEKMSDYNEFNASEQGCNGEMDLSSISRFL